MCFSIHKSLFLLALILLSFSCSKSDTLDPVTGDKKVYEPNAMQRARDAADSGQGIFSFGGSKKENTTFNFSTSNVLWRATLKSLDFLPLVNADYSGGIIITDWYSEQKSNEQIKLTIRFLSNEIKSNSISIVAHKKICLDQNNCKINKMEDNFTVEIKESIINSARLLKIEDEKNKNK